MHLHGVSKSWGNASSVLAVARVGGVKVGQIEDAGIESGSGQIVVTRGMGRRRKGSPSPFTPSILLSSAFPNDNEFETLRSPSIPVISICRPELFRLPPSI
jgi:hypothetical protein